MDRDDIEQAAQLLAEAQRGHRHIAALPEHPASPAEAHAIQARLVELSGQPIAGWKILTTPDGVSTWGVIYAEDCLASPATLAAGRSPLRGVEGEVAFRFIRDLPPRSQPYARDDIRSVLTAIPVIEIVDSRFADFQGTGVLDRLADRMSNGALIVGTATAGADARDLSALKVTLKRGGGTVLDQVGGHARKDPLLPVVEFVNARQAELSFRAGEIITAGSVTGIAFGQPGETYRLDFDGLGAVEVSFG